MIERKQVSYSNVERAVVAHQEAQGRRTGLLRLRSGDRAAVSYDAFHKIPSHKMDGDMSELFTPIESKMLVGKLKTAGILDSKHHVAGMRGLDAVLSSVEIGVGRKRLSTDQQTHVRTVLRVIRSNYSERPRGGEGLIAKVERLTKEIEGLNRQGEKILRR